jgi:hypothetical protein
MSVGVFENVFEIADGLMIVDGEGEFEFFHLIKVWCFWGKIIQTHIFYYDVPPSPQPSPTRGEGRKMKLKIQKEKLQFKIKNCLSQFCIDFELLIQILNFEF